MYIQAAAGGGVKRVPEAFGMDNKLHSYVEQSCLFLGMAGSGKSNILQEAQTILTTNEVFRLIQTASCHGRLTGTRLYNDNDNNDNNSLIITRYE